MSATPLALPLDVRRATRQAEEIHMGFAPTTVIGPAGKRYVLNWSVDVFAHADVVGSSLMLAPRAAWDNETPVVSQPNDLVTHVYADWTEDARALVPGE